MSNGTPETPEERAAREAREAAAAELALQKARHDYALREYEREEKRRGTLETKAQFYLTLFTAFLGAVFLSKDYLAGLRTLLGSDAVPGVLKSVITVALIGLGAGLIIALGGILVAFWLRKYQNPRPNVLIPALFVENSEAFRGKTEADFYKNNARSYAAAVDVDRPKNLNKAGAVFAASLGIKLAALALATLLVTTIYLQTYVVTPAPAAPQQVIIVTPTPAP